MKVDSLKIAQGTHAHPDPIGQPNEAADLTKGSDRGQGICKGGDGNKLILLRAKALVTTLDTPENNYA